MTLTCLVLAGGLGTRMSTFTTTMPKILIPVNNRPFLHHQLDLLEDQGFTRIVLSLGYLGSMVLDELERIPHENLDIEFMFDGPEPLGTGGAVRQVCQHHILDDYFFITYGDSYLEIDPRQVISGFDDSNFDALMTLYSNEERLEIANAKISQNGSVHYKKNMPNPSALGFDMVDFGMSYVSRQSLLTNILPEEPSDLAHYFEKISEEGRLQGFISAQRFYEIGSHAGRDALELYLSERKNKHDTR